jgi:hypothetical protein
LALKALLGALVGAIDLGVVGQLTGLPDAGVERLAWLVAAVIALVAIGLKEIAAVIGQGHCTIVGTERRRANQAFVLKVLEASPRTLRVVAEVLEVTLGDDPERADGRQRAALGAVNFVNAIAIPYQFTIASAR